MLQVLNLTAPSGIFTGADELAADLLRLLGITDKRLIQRSYSYELLSSIAGTALELSVWGEDPTLTETLTYELTLPGKGSLETANEVAKLLGLSGFKGIIGIQLKVEVGCIAHLAVSFEPRKAVETVGSVESTFTATEVGHAEIT